jgi:hypothetical protein
MRTPPETAELEDGRSALAGSPRATTRRCTWTLEPGASSKATSLFMLVTGSPPVATPVVRAALVALCGTNTLSSLGDAALVRALRSSSPTPVHPPRRLGVGVEVTASRWSPGRATLSRISLRAPARGEGSLELEPRRQSIRAGASVSDRRWPLHGGRQGGRRLRECLCRAGTGWRGSSCGPAPWAAFEAALVRGPKPRAGAVE